MPSLKGFGGAVQCGGGRAAVSNWERPVKREAGTTAANGASQGSDVVRQVRPMWGPHMRVHVVWIAIVGLLSSAGSGHLVPTHAAAAAAGALLMQAPAPGK